jgi:hypothetical protein
VGGGERFVTTKIVKWSRFATETVVSVFVRVFSTFSTELISEISSANFTSTAFPFEDSQSEEKDYR